jgi:hypothetical protein
MPVTNTAMGRDCINFISSHRSSSKDVTPLANAIGIALA